MRSTSRFVTEEVTNQWTHGIGFVLSLPAGWWLVQSTLSKHNSWLTTGCVIYAVTLSLLYAASTLSHSVHRGIWRHRFRTFDQVCIFLLSAGSYTPFGMVFLREGWWGVLLVTMWVLACVGIVLKLFFTKLHNVSTSFYLLVGWVPILAAPHYYRCLGGEGVALIGICATAYSAGTWFLVNDERKFHHAIWHLCVMFGSAGHYFLVLNYIVPRA
ncbi:MAG: hemolysin III family protein [Planctomycetaceae bacterium]